MGGAFTSYAWPEGTDGGFFLSGAGLLMGNARTGKYLQIGAEGNISMPGMTVVDGKARFGGELAAVTGTFQLVRSPTRSGPAGTAGSGKGYDLTAQGFQFFDSNNVVRIEIGDY